MNFNIFIIDDTSLSVSEATFMTFIKNLRGEKGRRVK